jgi:protein-L-isoaspartate(D-aspartate) O-methyltransferase
MSYEKQRRRMVDYQIKSRGIRDDLVLEAMKKVERHLFVPEEQIRYAYNDRPLSIGLDQTISQPYIVALMTEFLSLKGNEKVLEIGTGSGYQAAILGEIAAEVHSVERHDELAERASCLIASLGYTNVHIHVGDGSLGWPDEEPYDAVLVTAAAPAVPEPLKDQLIENGILVIPVGHPRSQLLEVWQKKAGGFMQKSVANVAFVPLLGEHGWDKDPTIRF